MLLPIFFELLGFLRKIFIIFIVITSLPFRMSAVNRDDLKRSLEKWFYLLVYRNYLVLVASSVKMSKRPLLSRSPEIINRSEEHISFIIQNVLRKNRERKKIYWYIGANFLTDPV